MEFHFNAELAKQYGVDGAIFLHCMAFWVAKNRANGRHYHEGRYLLLKISSMILLQG